MTPEMSTAPTRPIGTLRRGFAVSSASGADASKPPNATTASPKVMKMFDASVPVGHENGAADRPSAPPCARTAKLMISSTATSITYSTTVTRTPNCRPMITGTVTIAP